MSNDQELTAEELNEKLRNLEEEENTQEEQTQQEEEKPKKEFKKNPFFNTIGQQTKAEADVIEDGLPPTQEEMEEDNAGAEPMTVEELWEYADMLVDAWTMGMVMVARGISLNTMTEQQLSPPAPKLKSLKKVLTKVMYKYQKKAPLLFLFFLTLVMVYFPTFRDSWISRKAFKGNQLAKIPVNKQGLSTVMRVVQPGKTKRYKDMTPAEQAQFDREAEEETRLREEAREAKRRSGRAKKGFDYSKVIPQD